MVPSRAAAVRFQTCEVVFGAAVAAVVIVVAILPKVILSTSFLSPTSATPITVFTNSDISFCTIGYEN